MRNVENSEAHAHKQTNIKNTHTRINILNGGFLCMLNDTSVRLHLREMVWTTTTTTTTRQQQR